MCTICAHFCMSLLKLNIHQVGDAIQSSHPLSSPSPPNFNLPQHQGLFQWVSSLHQGAKVLYISLQHHWLDGHWVWVNSRSWWWTGRPGVLQSMGLQRVGHDWATELDWTSASASVLPVNIQDWFPLGLTGWISLQPKGLSRVFSNTTVQNQQFFGTQLSL